VVHLKRFSNNRSLRDKIDTLVDFPLAGLDLTSMVGERQVAKRLVENGEDIQCLGLKDIDEPLIYDLYAVDEHMGGLGGGHYRAYAYNNPDDKWYHFDDSYVSAAQASSSVTANAYLLFYKRRASRPLGGKSHEKVEAARQHVESSAAEKADSFADMDSKPESRLATPVHTPDYKADSSTLSRVKDPWPFENWTVSSNTQSSPASSPPPLDEAEPPAFDEALNHPIVQFDLGPLHFPGQRFEMDSFNFPDPASHGSPSSVKAEFDTDPEIELNPDGIEELDDRQDSQEIPFTPWVEEKVVGALSKSGQPQNSAVLNDEDGTGAVSDMAM